jgi:hypothetical protein
VAYNPSLYLPLDAAVPTSRPPEEIEGSKSSAKGMVARKKSDEGAVAANALLASSAGAASAIVDPSIAQLSSVLLPHRQSKSKSEERVPASASSLSSTAVVGARGGVANGAARPWPAAYVAAMTASGSNGGGAAASSTSREAFSLHPDPHAAGAGAWIERNKGFLACQMFSSAHTNLNAHLTGPLEKLEGINAALGDTWRTYAYRKAVGILKKLPKRVETLADLDDLRRQQIRGLGGKMFDKLREILSSGGRLAKLENLQNNDMVTAVQLFTKIHGVGAATARQWFTWGLRSIADVQRDPRVQLSATQKVGLKFMVDKEHRIPRLEVTALQEHVQRVAQRILPGVTVICCGSYRRGAPSSGDVDLLCTHASFTSAGAGAASQHDPSARLREDFLRKLLAELHKPLLPGTEAYEEEKRFVVDKYTRIKEETARIKREIAAATGQPASQQTPSPPAPAVPAADAAATAATASAAPAAAATAAVPPSSSCPGAGSRPLHTFVTGDLSTFEFLSSRHGQAYWMGFVSLPEFHPVHSGWSRRMDIKVSVVEQARAR